MSARQSLKERSTKRKELLAKSLGVASKEALAELLGTRAAGTSRDASWTSGEPPKAKAEAAMAAADDGTARSECSSPERVLIDDYYKVLMEEERVYKGSSAFLKGTQSANPHNDYSQNFVDTGQRPQNFIRDPGIDERFDEYPKLRELIKLKDGIVLQTATPPMYLRADPSALNLRELGCRFDVILIEPPLAEYDQSGGKQVWTWDMIEDLDLTALADQRCFIWLWCGSQPEGTARARQCFRRWGFRRCEDICWVKRNALNPSKRQQLQPDALFHRTKEHCLMGIRGTVRRSVDGDFIHANVDIDLIITEEPADVRQKPEEMMLIIEHFCLGRRRLHLFGRDETLRPGWLTIGPELTSSNFDARTYRSFFDKSPGLTTGCTLEVEQLRPKSPERGPPKGAQNRVTNLQTKGPPKRVVDTKRPQQPQTKGRKRPADRSTPAGARVSAPPPPPPPPPRRAAEERPSSSGRARSPSRRQPPPANNRRTQPQQQHLSARKKGQRAHTTAQRRQQAVVRQALTFSRRRIQQPDRRRGFNKRLSRP